MKTTAVLLIVNETPTLEAIARWYFDIYLYLTQLALNGHNMLM
jgi:hypothetical protein